MSDTQRSYNRIMVEYYKKIVAEIKSGKRARYGKWGRIKKDLLAEAERQLAIYQKSPDGKTRSDWRYEGAKHDGSGKLNTFDETGAPRRGCRRLKRQASKDTRRFGKEIARKELDNL